MPSNFEDLHPPSPLLGVYEENSFKKQNGKGVQVSYLLGISFKELTETLYNEIFWVKLIDSPLLKLERGAHLSISNLKFQVDD